LIVGAERKRSQAQKEMGPMRQLKKLKKQISSNYAKLTTHAAQGTPPA